MMIDPITLEPIPNDRLISFEQLGIQYHFDIDTLYRTYTESFNMYNPYNRQPLPSDVVDRIRSTYYLRMKIDIILPGDIVKTIYTKRIVLIGDIIVKVVGSHVGITNLTRYDIRYNDRSIYNTNRFLQPIIAIANSDIVLTVLLDDNDNRRALRRYNLYVYGTLIDDRRICNMIPIAYRREPPPIRIPSKIDHKMISDYIEYGIDRPNIPIEYYTIGISRLLDGANIDYTFAIVVEKYINRLSIRYGSQSLWDKLLDELYDRVVNRHLLPMDHKYYRDRPVA